MQQVVQSPVTPVMETIGPAWFHDHGSKMKLRRLDAERGIMLLESSAASVQFFRGEKEVIVNWAVIYSPLSQVHGRISISLSQLTAAFALPWDEYPIGLDHGQWMLDRFGGDSAIQGCFIRYQEFLNIPGPGTGHNGDPNVLIMIDDQIKEAVIRFLDW